MVVRPTISQHAKAWHMLHAGDTHRQTRRCWWQRLLIGKVHWLCIPSLWNFSQQPDTSDVKNLYSARNYHFSSNSEGQACIVRVITFFQKSLVSQSMPGAFWIFLIISLISSLHDWQIKNFLMFQFQIFEIKFFNKFVILWQTDYARYYIG